MDLLTLLEIYYIPITALYSLLIGSFLNVVIYRLPKMMQREWQAECHHLYPEAVASPSKEAFNLCLPRSRCPNCNNEIKAMDNIPILSWFNLNGKCRYCQIAISKRYPLVELLTASLATISAVVIPFSAWSVAALFATFVLIVLCFIDLDTMLLPDQITLPFMWSGILLALLEISPISLQNSVMGAILGYLFLWLVFHGFKLITGKEGLGYGDFKLLAALGAWLGWQSLPFVILLASVLGTVGGLITLKLRNQNKDHPFSFGPYLAAAGWGYLLWGDLFHQWYLAFYL